MDKTRLITWDRLSRAECYAYNRWLLTGCVSKFWYHLACVLCSKVKEYEDVGIEP